MSEDPSELNIGHHNHFPITTTKMSNLIIPEHSDCNLQQFSTCTENAVIIILTFTGSHKSLCTSVYVGFV